VDAYGIRMLALAKRRGARATEAMEEIDDRPRTNLTNLKQHAVSHLSAAVHDMIDLKPELQDARAIKRADGPH
jgi:hypothetical protein